VKDSKKERKKKAKLYIYPYVCVLFAYERAYIGIHTHVQQTKNLPNFIFVVIGFMSEKF